MKIAYITAGAAGMYCGSCLHDNTTARTLQQRGVDVVLIPCYTPIRTDEEDVSHDKVFLTGINVYLQQKFSFWGKMPKFVHKMLESPALLKWVSKLTVSTDARDLGKLAVAVIRGDEGNLREEVEKMVAWLRDDLKPDVVQLTNAMFAGFAGRMKEELNVPVICSLQGEDIFLDDLIEPYKKQAFEALKRKCADIDGFIVHSEYYRDYMPGYLGIDREKIHVVPLGIELEDHGPGSDPNKEEPFTIGFLARRAPEKGLHLLVDAFITLAERVGKEKVRLRIAGYLAPKDRGYEDEQRQKLIRAGLADRVEHMGEVDRAGKMDLLNGIHVLSMPSPYREPKGLSLLEAMAHGVPVVQPDHGAFPELIAETGGGILVKPEDHEALVTGLQRMMDEPELRRSLGEKGRRAVLSGRDNRQTAKLTLAVYHQFAGRN
ncbi:MAG: glycosyltransferase family 4 protein [Acidobacteriota bacterium]|nr:glycosyltransferase family 4 protein [Acidobacteriota bacterium]